jgi:methylation protein EvaC
MRRLHCGACAGTRLDVFLDLGETPLANTYPASLGEKETWYPLQLGVCGNCGLVQLMEVVPDVEIYGGDYGFYSGGSPAQLGYHSRGARLLLDRFAGHAQRLTIEVACNDGSLLHHFADHGCRTLGIDPAAGPVEVARARGLDVIAKPLSTALAQQVRKEYGPAGLVIAYNSMAHVEDLADVLAGVRALMDADSVAVFEVQYLPDLLAGNMYDQVYHEHRFFYSLTSLRHATGLHGLYVVDAELIELQGGGIRVTLSADPDAVPTPAVARIVASEQWLSLAYPGFQGKVDRTRDHLRSLVEAELAKGSLAGYGAAAKATTILNFCGIGPESLKYVVDTTPFKQGRYLPGTGLRIVSPKDAAEDPAYTLLLLVANYLGTVLRSNPHKGPWVVPLPLPAVI